MSFDQPMPPFNASDPSASFLSTSCLDFLMIELVPMTYRVAHELDASSPESSLVETNGNSGGGAAAGGDVSSVVATATGTAGSRRLDEDEERDAVFFRLEGLGYRVGLGLVERYAFFWSPFPPYSPFSIRSKLKSNKPPSPFTHRIPLPPNTSLRRETVVLHGL